MNNILYNTLLGLFIILLASCSSSELEPITDNADAIAISTRSSNCNFDCNGGTFPTSVTITYPESNCGICIEISQIGAVGPIEWCADIEASSYTNSLNGVLDDTNEQICFTGLKPGAYELFFTLEDGNGKCLTRTELVHVTDCVPCTYRICYDEFSAGTQHIIAVETSNGILPLQYNYCVGSASTCGQWGPQGVNIFHDFINHLGAYLFSIGDPGIVTLENDPRCRGGYITITGTYLEFLTIETINLHPNFTGQRAAFEKDCSTPIVEDEVEGL